ncbi:MAG: aminodeoxychorismate lyase [Pseudomonadota bacterium]
MSMLINGKATDAIQASDRGLLYGDGLFETLGFLGDHCPLWSLHLARLERGCRMLGITMPTASLLLEECLQLVDGQEPSVIRLTVTRGIGGRGYWPDPGATPTRILTRKDWPLDQRRQQEEGLTAIVSSLRLSHQPALSGLKHCNRLEQILAAQECQQLDAEEALLLDHNGQLAEAISSNVLARIDGAWLTPNSPSAVAGVGLEWLLDREEISINHAAISGRLLPRADSILVINSISGPRPLRRLDDRNLIIDGDCRQMQLLWNQHLIPPCDD